MFNRRRWFHFSLALGLLCTLSAAAHEWKDATGSFNIKGEFLSLKQGLVYIEKADGKIIKVPLEKLSAADQEFVKGQSGEGAPATNETEAPIPAVKTRPSSEPTKSASKGPKKPVNNDQAILKLTVTDEDMTGEVRRFRELGYGAHSTMFSPDGRYLAVGTYNSLMVFDVEREKRVEFQDKLDTSGQIQVVAFSPDGTKFVSGGSKGRCVCWNVDKGHLDSHKQYGGHTDGVLAVTFSPDSQMILSAGEDKKASYWKFENAEEVYFFDGFENDVKATWIAPSGKLGIASDGKIAQLLDLENGKVKGRMLLHKYSANAVSISPDGKFIAAAEGYNVHQWDTKSGRELATLKDNSLPYSCQYSSSGKHLVSGSNQLNLFTTDNGRRINIFDIEGGSSIRSLSFSPDGRHVAVINSYGGRDVIIIRLPKLD